MGNNGQKAFIYGINIDRNVIIKGAKWVISGINGWICFIYRAGMTVLAKRAIMGNNDPFSTLNIAMGFNHEKWHYFGISAIIGLNSAK